MAEALAQRKRSIADNLKIDIIYVVVEKYACFIEDMSGNVMEACGEEGVRTLAGITKSLRHASFL